MIAGVRLWLAGAEIGASLLGAAAANVLADQLSAGPQLVFHPRYRVSHLNGVITDGRYTFLQANRPGRLGLVLDEVTGKRTYPKLPSGCLNPRRDPSFGPGWLLEDCDASHVDLYNLVSRTWHSVSLFANCRALLAAGGSSDCTPTAVGTDWIQYDAATLQQGDKLVFQAIATGAVRRDPTNATTVPDLDSPRLARHVCAPLRVPRPGSFVPLGQFAIADSPAGTFLEQCGTRRRRRLIDLADVYTAPGEVLWTPTPRKIDGIFLSSQQTFSIAPPRNATFIVYITANAHHIYLEGETRRNDAASWIAAAPR